MENMETQSNKKKSFFGTFVLIYLALNNIAFFIMLLTTKQSMIIPIDVCKEVLFHQILVSILFWVSICLPCKANKEMSKKYCL